MSKTVRFIYTFLTFSLVAASILAVSDMFPDRLNDSKWFISVGVGLIMLVILSVFGLMSSKVLCADMMRRTFSNSVLIVCFLEAILILLQKTDVVAGVGLNVMGSFDNIAGFVSAMCLGLPLGLSVAKGYRKRIFVPVVMMLVCAMVILCSCSRTGVLCLCLLFFLYLPRKNFFRHAILMVPLFASVVFFCFFSKQDSTKGRWFIAARTVEMIKEKPILGWGYGGFTANYMNKQAVYFKKYPNDSSRMLADNIRHPMSEFLLVCVNYGLLGLLAVIVATICFVCYLYNKKTDQRRLLLAEISILIVLSLFSYPFAYPFTWIIVAYVICNTVSFIRIRSRIVAIVSLVIACALFLPYIRELRSALQCRTSQGYVALGKYGKAIRGFERLYPTKLNDYVFLYSYAFALEQIGKNEEAQKIIETCERHVADYNVQLLKGDIFAGLCHYNKAEKAYIKAHYMCPSRLTPLYDLCLFYISVGRRKDASEVRQKALAMPIKVDSESTRRIRMEIELLKIN